MNIVYREEKKNFCKGKDWILIDDHPGNIASWREYGGTGILHVSAEETMKEMKNWESCADAVSFGSAEKLPGVSLR